MVQPNAIGEAASRSDREPTLAGLCASRAAAAANADRLRQPATIEPVDPFPGRVLVALQPAPRVAVESHFGYRIVVFYEYELIMTLTVRLDTALETRLDAEARRLGITKSEVVTDALERALGLKDPATLLKAVRSRRPMGNPDASQNVSRQVRAKLGAKRSA